MKKHKLAILCLIIYCSTLIPFATAKASASSTKGSSDWPAGPSVYADSAIVMEASTGLVLYEKNIDKQQYPASITKIMTALLAIENSSPGEIVTFSKDAVFNVDLDSSRIGIDVGEQLTMQQCLYAILLESANEVTYAVAEHVGGTVDNFVKMMNDRAKALGCKNTNFTNPHGLPDDAHVTTAYDMALITREAMKNETFRKIFATRTYQIPPTNIQPETRYLRNHHKFVLNQDYKYDGTIGGKTGYTTKARYTLVTVVKRGDLELICVVMRDDSNEHQYTDTAKLLDYGYDNFSIYPIADLEKSPDNLSESPLFTRYNSVLSKSDNLITTDKNGYLVLPNTASFEDAKKEINFYSKPETKNGNNIIGNISYTYDGKYVGGADIIYNAIDTPKLFNKQLDRSENIPAPNDTKPVKSRGYFRPVIIGAIIGLFVLIIILYFILVERPRLRRKSAYYRKRANRRRHFHDDDFLDL